MAVATPQVAAAPRSAAARVRSRAPVLATRGPYVARVALLVGLYYGSAKLGYVLHFSGPVAAIVWLPVGVAVAFLSLFGLAYWPGALIGDLLANAYTAIPLGGALGQTCGNMLEVLVAAYLIRRLSRRGPVLESMRGVGGMLFALALGTLISALIGPISLALSGGLSWSTLPTAARVWWLGDACGALVVVPLALAWHRPQRWHVNRLRAIEAALLVVSLFVLTEIATRSDQPVAYLIFPALIWAALRFGTRGATLAVAIAVSLTVWDTTHYGGPFAFNSMTHRLLSTQLFIAVSAISTLCLAAVVAERETIAERLGESRAQIFRAAETERRRIERNLHDGAQQRLLALAVHLRLAAENADGSWQDLVEAEHELQLAIDELRELSHGTHPSVLTELGLADAARSVAARSTVPVTMLELPATRLDPAVEAAAYYVLSETIVNTHKHARATSIRVRITAVEHLVHVDVADNGHGGAVTRPGSGLDGLRERVEALGGDFRVTSSFRGTRVSALIPAEPR